MNLRPHLTEPPPASVYCWLTLIMGLVMYQAYLWALLVFMLPVVLAGQADD